MVYNKQTKCSKLTEYEINILNYIIPKFNIPIKKELIELLNKNTTYSRSYIRKVLTYSMKPSKKFIEELCYNLNIECDDLDKLINKIESNTENSNGLFYDFYTTIPEKYREIIIELRNIGMNTFEYGDTSFCCESYAKTKPEKLIKEFRKLIKICKNVSLINYHVYENREFWQIYFKLEK